MGKMVERVFDELSDEEGEQLAGISVHRQPINRTNRLWQQLRRHEGKAEQQVQVALVKSSWGGGNMGRGGNGQYSLDTVPDHAGKWDTSPLRGGSIFSRCLEKL